MMNAVAQANIDKYLGCAFFARFRIHSGVDEWKLNVAQTGGAREQIKCLKNEANFPISNRREFVIVHGCHVLAAKLVTSGSGSVEATKHVHERRFAAAAWPHDRDVFVVVNLERDPAQSPYDFFAHHIVLGDVLDVDDEGTPWLSHIRVELVHQTLARGATRLFRRFLIVRKFGAVL